MINYKVICVHVDTTKQAERRIQIGARLAAQEGSHFVGIAATGVVKQLMNPSFPKSTIACLPDPYNPAYLQAVHEKAEQALQKFELIAKENGITSYEKKCIHDIESKAVSLYAAYSDLIIVGQNDNDDPAASARSSLAESIAINSRTPLLLIPNNHQALNFGNRVLIAWDGSIATLQAVKKALPFLVRAPEVNVAIIQFNSRLEYTSESTLSLLSNYLTYHGVELHVTRQAAESTAGHALLSLAEALNCQLIVAGCMPHPRPFDLLAGGTTRILLEETAKPILMAH